MNSRIDDISLKVKIMKKFISVLSLLLLSFSLIACNDTKDLQEVLVLPQNIETINVEAESAVPYLYAPLEITKEDDTYNDLLLWLNELEFTQIEQSKIEGCAGSTDYGITINNDTKFSYIDGCGYYAKIDDQFYEVSNPIAFPFDLDDFPIADLLNCDLLIRPTKFSNETYDVLNILQPEIRFLDVTVGSEIGSQRLSVYEYDDGIWQEISYMKIIDHQYQLAFQFFEDYLDIYFIKENSVSKQSVSIEEFDGDQISAINYVQDDTALETGEEVNVILKLGTQTNNLETFDIQEDFRVATCNHGIAVVLKAE